ncbi:MAG: hypothetical protein GSR74_01965 [Desulfurococcales archaeon]|nr:hypothetical protein [Desulfurococcales archaeon]
MSEEIPEDVLEELLEISKEIEEEIGRRPRRRAKYPSAREIAQAVAEAAKMFRGADPQEFPDLVRKLLEDEGYDTRHVTDRRIWRTYETLVRRGVIRDTLGVVMW